MFKFQRFKGYKPSKEQLKADQTKKKVQDWLPFQGLDNGKIVTKDGRVIALARVLPINILLKSEKETERVIHNVHEAINGLREPIQILCVQRPVDLEAYLSSLAEKARNVTDYRKKLVLSNYIRYVSSLAASGEAKEKRFFILTSNKGKGATEEVSNRIEELVARLNREDLHVHSLDDAELLDLLFTFHNPAQAAFETVENYTGSTRYEREGQ